MDSSIIAKRIEWLTAQGTPGIENCVAHDLFRQAVPISENIGKGFIDVLRLRLGIVIGRGVHTFLPVARGILLPLADFRGDLTEPTLIIHSAKTGQVLLKNRTDNLKLPYDRERSVFQYVEQIDYQPIMNTDRDIEVSVMHIGISVLRMLLGKQATEKLMAALRLKRCPCARSIRVPAFISKSLHEAHQTSFHGEMRKLHAQAKVLEYLCALTAFLVDSDSLETSLDLDLRIQQAAEELTRLEGRIPPIVDLAAGYGISLTVLNEGFKRLFGSTVYAFIKDCRMKAAHTALMESDEPMKAIAHRFGYSHVNHFITAFKKHYGFTPGSIRKGIKQGPRRLTAS